MKVHYLMKDKEIFTFTMQAAGIQVTWRKSKKLIFSKRMSILEARLQYKYCLLHGYTK
jgi:hypothetical protein